MVDRSRRDVLQVSGALLGGVAVGSTVTAAESSDRFVVQTKGHGTLEEFDVVHELPGVDFAVVRGSESELSESSRVTAFAPDIEIQAPDPATEPESAEADATPTDEPFYPLQWDKQVQDIQEVHETTQGEDTRVAVLDTGIPESHPDFQSSLNTELSQSFTETDDHEPQGVQYHGTHVGGIIAADDNGVGIVGTAPKTDLVDLRVFEALGEGASFADILAAIIYAVNVDSDVANLSLGAYPIPRQGIGEFYGKVLNSIMTYANKEGTLLVIAAGNVGADLQRDKNLISLPNEGAQALSVAATTSVGFDPSTGTANNPGFEPASYTNYGTNAITLAAPGGDVPPGGGTPDLVFSAIPQAAADRFFGEGAPPYAYLAGTSMAAPQVAGAAALVKSANPDFNTNQVKAALTGAAEVPNDYDRTYYGSGFLNVGGALDEL